MNNHFDYQPLIQRMKDYRFSRTSLADDIGIGRTAMSYKFNHKSYFSQKEIKDICKVLEIPAEEIGHYFFTPVVRKTVSKEKILID